GARIAVDMVASLGPAPYSTGRPRAARLGFTSLQPALPGPRLLSVDERWGGGGGTDGAAREGWPAAPDEASWERHTRILDTIEQVRAARELRRRRGLALPTG